MRQCWKFSSARFVGGFENALSKIICMPNHLVIFICQWCQIFPGVCFCCRSCRYWSHSFIIENSVHFEHCDFLGVVGKRSIPCSHDSHVTADNDWMLLNTTKQDHQVLDTYLAKDRLFPWIFCLNMSMLKGTSKTDCNHCTWYLLTDGRAQSWHATQRLWNAYLSSGIPTQTVIPLDVYALSFGCHSKFQPLVYTQRNAA